VSDARELIHNPDIDALVICAPTGLHAELAVAALENGKHVFIEKPIATTLLDARRVIDAASASGLTAMVGYSRRLHPLYLQAKRMIAGDELGRVHAIQSAFCEPISSNEMSEWRKKRSEGGGVLLDLGSHHFDLVRWFLDDDVASVACSTECDPSDEHTAQVSLAMNGGTTVQSFFSFRTARADYLEFIGERGTLLLDRHRPSLGLRVARRWGYGTRRQVVMPDPPAAKWRLRRLTSPSYEPSYANAIQSFVDAIHGKPCTGATLADAARSLDVVLAAEESARTDSRISLTV
jgi:predicted dehydrogenase